MNVVFFLLSAVTFMEVLRRAWDGHLGIGVLILMVSCVLFLLGRRNVAPEKRKGIDFLAKALFTIAGVVALLRHPIQVEEAVKDPNTGEVVKAGVDAPLFEAISMYIDQVDSNTFITFALVAMAVKFVGVITSAYAWHLLLKGQGVRLPFWNTIMTSFLIGRFIGTFLPSTIGLDGYTLYEANRYSNETERVVTAKALEKFIGVTGLFLGMVLTMPFGYSVITDVMTKLEQPDAAPLLAGGILVVAGGISLVVIIGLLFPQLTVMVIRLVSRLFGAITDKLQGFADDAARGQTGPFSKLAFILIRLTSRLFGATTNVLQRFADAAGAYKGKLGLLMTALVSKFITHFTTFVVYYFTGLAIGVVGMEFWPVVFGSSIQVLATLLSPTVAGEGAREAFQALLLSNQYGGAAQAVLAGALGFIAAEAATMWGGAFLWTRTPQWRPTFAEVDGKQVDYEWLEGDEGSFSADAVKAIQKKGTTA